MTIDSFEDRNNKNPSRQFKLTQLNSFRYDSFYRWN